MGIVAQFATTGRPTIHVAGKAQEQLKKPSNGPSPPLATEAA